MQKRVLLVGIGPTAEAAFTSLVDRFALIAMLRDDCGDDPLCARARERGVSVIGPASSETIEVAVAKLRPDCVVVSSFHRLIPGWLLERCPFVNVHYALLPKYRGRANVNWAIINGEKSTGITIHRMAVGVDAGEILFQAAEPIGPTDTVTDLYARLNAIQAASLGPAVERMLDGVPGVQQSEADASYTCTRTPDDGEIDWSSSSTAVHNLVRALTPPFLGAFTYLEGKRLVIWDARRIDAGVKYVGRVPGRVVAIDRDAGSVDVLCGDGAIRLIAVQAAGEERTTAARLICSSTTTLGLRTVDLLRRIEVLEREASALRLRVERSSRPAVDTAYRV